MSDKGTGLLKFLAEVMRLKAVPRIGWLLRGVRDVESVASHVYGTACVAMLIADRARQRGLTVDVERVLRMALLHDIPEARTGDLPSTVKTYFGRENVRAGDAAITAEILAPLGELKTHYLELLSDYEHRTSLEARIVKAADKFDLLLQSCEYERGGARYLQEFWDTADADFAQLSINDLIGDLIAELKERRKS